MWFSHPEAEITGDDAAQCRSPPSSPEPGFCEASTAPPNRVRSRRGHTDIYQTLSFPVSGALVISSEAIDCVLLVADRPSSTKSLR
jgi:hypothetical protein